MSTQINVLAGEGYIYPRVTITRNTVFTDLATLIYRACLTSTSGEFTQTFASKNKVRLQTSLPHNSSGIAPVQYTLQLEISGTYVVIADIIFPVNLDDSGDNYRWHLDLLIEETEGFTGIKLVRVVGDTISSFVINLTEWTTARSYTDSTATITGVVDVNLASQDAPAEISIVNQSVDLSIINGAAAFVADVASVSGDVAVVNGSTPLHVEADVTSIVDVPVVNGATHLAVDSNLLTSAIDVPVVNGATNLNTEIVASVDLPVVNGSTPLEVNLGAGGAEDVWVQYNLFSQHPVGTRGERVTRITDH